MDGIDRDWSLCFLSGQNEMTEYVLGVVVVLGIVVLVAAIPCLENVALWFLNKKVRRAK